MNHNLHLFDLACVFFPPFPEVKMIVGQILVFAEVVFTPIISLVADVAQRCAMAYQIGVVSSCLSRRASERSRHPDFHSDTLVCERQSTRGHQRWGSSGKGSVRGKAGKEGGQAPHLLLATDLTELSTHPSSTKPGSHWAGAHVMLKSLQTLAPGSPSIPSPGVKLLGMPILERQDSEDGCNERQYLCRQRHITPTPVGTYDSWQSESPTQSGTLVP